MFMFPVYVFGLFVYQEFVAARNIGVKLHLAVNKFKLLGLLNFNKPTLCIIYPHG